MANKIIIVLIIALVVMLVLSLTAKDEGFNEPPKYRLWEGRMTQPLVNGNYKFALDDQRLALYDMYHQQKVIWEVPSSPGNYLTLQRDGNLVLYNSNDKWVWDTETAYGYSGTPYYLDLSPNGSLIIKDRNQRVIKEVISEQTYHNDCVGKSSLTSDYNIGLVGRMTQPLCNGDSKLVLEDNRLVVYAPVLDGDNEMRIKAIWEVPSSPGNYLVMQSDGNLVLYDSSGTSVWSSKTNGRGRAAPYKLNLDADGKLYITDKERAYFSSPFFR